MEYTVDIAIIGAGTAGQSAYRTAVKQTDSVLLINQDTWGTTCAQVGCMPSKLLIAAANRSHEAQRLEVFGLSSRVTVDGAAVLQRVRAERDRFTQSVVDAVQQWPEKHRLTGHAVLKSLNTIQVGGKHVVKAKKILIATGSKPVIPKPWQAALGERLLTTDSVFELDQLPARLAVIGAGAIGLELAQAFHRLGVQVTLISQSSKLGILTDPVLQANAHAVLQDELTLKLDCMIDRMTTHETGARVFYTDIAGQSHQLTVDYVLCAIGRSPNLTSMHLDQWDIALDDHGLPVDFDPLSGRIGNTSLFMAGDVNTMRPLLHEAAYEGQQTGQNLARYPDIRRSPRRTALSIVFCDPQMAIIGQSYQDLQDNMVKQKQDFSIGHVSFADQGRCQVMAINQGALRIYAQPETGLLLGAEIFGPAAEHLAHLLAWSIQQSVTIAQMLECPFYHPVIEEGVRTALRDVQRAMNMGPQPVQGCLDCGAGA